MTTWISPSAAMDLVYDDPAGTGPTSDFGFALLWAKPRPTAPPSRTADLARAKLQPRKPTSPENKAAGEGWAITAHAHRLVLAAGVPDADSPRALFEGYDRAIENGQNLLAVVQTLRMPRDITRHDMLHAGYMYAAICLRVRHLSSLVVAHTPGDVRSARAPHVHILTLCRTHWLSGWADVHPVFADKPPDMHRAFEAEWHAFRATLERTGV